MYCWHAAAMSTLTCIPIWRNNRVKWLRGFGNMLIVDHGGGYMTVYGGGEALMKSTGDKVRAGDTVATTGASGGGSDNGLYFEIRHLGRPLNPMSWAQS